jgi:hypothetical protein
MEDKDLAQTWVFDIKKRLK